MDSIRHSHVRFWLSAEPQPEAEFTLSPLTQISIVPCARLWAALDFAVIKHSIHNDERRRRTLHQARLHDARLCDILRRLQPAD